MNFDKQIKLLAISYDSYPRERPAGKKLQFRNSDFTSIDFLPPSGWLFAHITLSFAVIRFFSAHISFKLGAIRRIQLYTHTHMYTYTCTHTRGAKKCTVWSLQAKEWITNKGMGFIAQNSQACRVCI